MFESRIPQILKIPWTYLEQEKAEVNRIIVNQQEFYAISYAGNLLFNPEEINAARSRFNNYPNIEKTWPIWMLSESDISVGGGTVRIGCRGLGLGPNCSPFREGIHADGRFLGLCA